MAEDSTDLRAMEAQLDALDGELLALMNRRAKLAIAIGAALRARDGDDTTAYRPEHEARQLAEFRDRNKGPLEDTHVQRVVTELMSACRALQSPVNVAFLGPAGTYTEAAALKHFGNAVKTSALGTIDAVFRDVESGSSDYGVVPVENSTEGMVNHTLDTFLSSELTICGEVMLPIHHCLLTNCQNLSGVKRVYSHQQSLAQCRKWLDTHLPHAERHVVSSNAEGARIAGAGGDAAAIAGAVAGDIYRVPVLVENIEDEPGNSTRFLIIGHQSVATSGDDKTTVMFWFRNRPGGLFHAIEVFARRNINMTRIESRPSRLERWNYVFYVDVEGHRGDALLSAALAELAERTDFLKILGSFPRAPREA